MRYGIPADSGDGSTRLGNIVEVPDGVDAPAWLAVQMPTLTGWIVVPDGIVSGATLVAGEWANPAVATPKPATLTDTEFAELCYAQLGALRAPDSDARTQLLAGIARRGEILLACKNTSDPATFEAYTRFTKATAYTLTTVQDFFAIIGPAPGSGILQPAEAAAIVGNWRTE